MARPGLELDFAARVRQLCPSFAAEAEPRAYRKSAILTGSANGGAVLAKRLRKADAVWAWYFARELAIYRAAPTARMPRLIAAADDVLVIERVPGESLATKRRPSAALPIRTIAALLAACDELAQLPAPATAPPSPRVLGQLHERLLEIPDQPSWVRDGVRLAARRGLLAEPLARTFDEALARYAATAFGHGDLLLRNAICDDDDGVMLSTGSALAPIRAIGTARCYGRSSHHRRAASSRMRCATAPVAGARFSPSSASRWSASCASSTRSRVARRTQTRAGSSRPSSRSWPRVWTSDRRRNARGSPRMTLVGTHDIALITLDTLRYDVAASELAAGRTPSFAKAIGAWQRRHAPGTFTLASHAAFFAGFLPTPEAPGRHPRRFALAFAGSETIGPETDVLDGASIVEGLALRGYHTLCIGGVGFFNQQNPLGRVFPSMFAEAHWSRELGVTDPHSFEHQLEVAERSLAALPADRRAFTFINVSALHQPNHFYAPDGPERDTIASHAAALRYIDGHVPRMLSILKRRAPLFAIICSDHGTLYGEDGYVGHRVAHPIVTTVPYAEIECA